MNQKTIEKLFTDWKNALQERDADKITSLYAEDAVFMPTLSGKIRRNHAETKDYFVHFMASQPKAKIHTSHVRIYEKVMINSGLYLFDLIREGQPAEVLVRFTFVYEQRNGQWLIVEHHSSLLPDN